MTICFLVSAEVVPVMASKRAPFLGNICTGVKNVEGVMKQARNF